MFFTQTDEMNFCDKTSKKENLELSEKKLTKSILKRNAGSLKESDVELKTKKKVKWETLSDSAVSANHVREVESVSSKKVNLQEDIYGRLRDSEGNIVTPAKTCSYIPPALRKLSADNQTDERIIKQIKGIINR